MQELLSPNKKKTDEIRFSITVGQENSVLTTCTSSYLNVRYVSSFGFFLQEKYKCSLVLHAIPKLTTHAFIGTPKGTITGLCKPKVIKF